MAEEANGESRAPSRERSGPSSEVLLDALEATDRQLRRLCRIANEQQIFDEDDAQKNLAPTRRRLRENRELLTGEDEQRDRGEKGANGDGDPRSRQLGELHSEILFEALEASDRHVRRLLRIVAEHQSPDTQDPRNDLRPTRRRLRENRALLTGEDEQRDRGDVQEGHDSESRSRGEDEPGDRGADRESGDGGDGGQRAEQNISAPSLGPNTVIEREPVEERLARHEQSEVDAMGRDKRRSVVGQRVGPSKTRQLVVYLGFLAVVAALVVGGIILVGALDTGVGKNVPNSAPWAKQGAKQIKPKPIQ